MYRSYQLVKFYFYCHNDMYKTKKILPLQKQQKDFPYINVMINSMG